MKKSSNPKLAFLFSEKKIQRWTKNQTYTYYKIKPTRFSTDSVECRKQNDVARQIDTFSIIWMPLTRIVGVFFYANYNCPHLLATYLRE